MIHYQNQEHDIGTMYVYSSVITYAYLYNYHHHSQDTELFCQPKDLMLLLKVTPLPAHSSFYSLNKNF